jgi:hypothetical protein
MYGLNRSYIIHMASELVLLPAVRFWILFICEEYYMGILFGALCYEEFFFLFRNIVLFFCFVFDQPFTSQDILVLWYFSSQIILVYLVYARCMGDR